MAKCSSFLLLLLLFQYTPEKQFGHSHSVQLHIQSSALNKFDGEKRQQQQSCLYCVLYYNFFTSSTSHITHTPTTEPLFTKHIVSSLALCSPFGLVVAYFERTIRCTHSMRWCEFMHTQPTQPASSVEQSRLHLQGATPDTIPSVHRK